MIQPLIAMPGGWELVLIVLVIVLLFGARKLPELARGTGQALRIFKSETKGLTDDDEPRKNTTTDAATTRTATTETPHALGSGTTEAAENLNGSTGASDATSSDAVRRDIANG